MRGLSWLLEFTHSRAMLGELAAWLTPPGPILQQKAQAAARPPSAPGDALQSPVPRRGEGPEPAGAESGKAGAGHAS